MATKNFMPSTNDEICGATISRRRALALLLGACPWLRGAPAAPDGNMPIRLSISASMLGDVNINDARVAMALWIKKITEDISVAMSPNLFSSTQEIQDGVRKGQLDAVAVNVVEYRPIADLLDARQIITSAGDGGFEHYLILVKQNSGIRQLSDLKGRRLSIMKAPKMCVANSWLLTTLEEGHHGPMEQFFGPVVTEAKLSRVVLPVFFGQTDACLTTKHGFDTMCELNPQVAKELKVIAGSAPMVVSFYLFRKNYQNPNREKLIRALSTLSATAAGRQLATLFHFDDLSVRDGSCLASSLSILEGAERIQNRRDAAGRKG